MSDEDFTYLQNIKQDDPTEVLSKDRLTFEEDMICFGKAIELLELLQTTEKNEYSNAFLDCAMESFNIEMRRYRRDPVDKDEDSISDALIKLTNDIINRVSQYLEKTFSHLETMFDSIEPKLQKLRDIAGSITEFTDGAELELTRGMSVFTYAGGLKIIDIASMLEALSLYPKTVDLIHDLERENPDSLFDELMNGKHLSGMFNTIVGIDSRLANKSFQLGAQSNADKYIVLNINTVNRSGEAAIRTNALAKKLGKTSIVSQRDIIRLLDSSLSLADEMQALKLGSFAKQIRSSMEKTVRRTETSSLRDVTPVIRMLVSLAEACCTYQYYLLSHTREYTARCLIAGRKKIER